AKWNTRLLGTQNDDGYILAATWQGQEVNASDAYGMTLVEAIYLGLNWRLRFRGLEFNKVGILASLQAFGSTGDSASTFTPTLANIGDRFSKFAKTLQMDSIIGTDPPTMPTSLTALSAIVAPQSNVEYLMTSKVREAPFEFVLLPYQATVASLTVNLSFTTT
ncbi:MAG: hypothetical protein Q7N50_09335, partial [Armatimonadota bacterium]|nr:hypothetical protein [Armatimonadota bacterium]